MMSQTEYHETGPKGGFSSAGHIIYTSWSGRRKNVRSTLAQNYLLVSKSVPFNVVYTFGSMYKW